jgi:MFS transporter, DHA1 family, inner membrane transport protein
MPYLSNTAVNRLNIHTGMHMLAYNLSANFFIIFLLSHGLNVTEVFLYLAFILALRFALRPIVLYVAPRIGSRRTLYIGSFLYAAQYLVLAHVQGVNTIFWAYCAVAALTDIFYWTSYHSIFAFTGDETHRGKQISVREALITFVNIVAPLIGGLGIDVLGAKSVFAAAAVIEILAILPLLKVPDLPIDETRPKGAFSAVKQGVAIFITDGWIVVGLTFVWAAKLFGATGSSFTTFGGALALAGLVSAIGGLVLGRILDSGHARRAVLVNGVLLIVALVLKSGASQGLSTMFAVTALSSLMGAGYMPTLMTAIYSLAARAPCTLRFIFVTEGAWDIGCASACLATVGLMRTGMALGWAIALAIFGAVMQMVLLYFYYARRVEKV